MAFIDTGAAAGTNYERAFALRPDVYAAWGTLCSAVKANMDERRYELATLAAARRLGSSYCSLAHGSVLAERHMEPAAVRAAALDRGGLDARDVAIMDLAEQVVADATAVTAQDVERLRGHGLTDAEIFDVVATAAMRCFFAKTLDALGVRPDARFAAVDPELREVLEVGRPIADA